ncbi:DUF6266 family protein [Pedobacter frigoris]|uniref:DUF6266 family protein n=1 Tax=Pedobacter frigoris TaxID=2571272 RepID=UPI002930B941|nr:DUF6266 family protein [Pedobacter frigoris]
MGSMNNGPFGPIKGKVGNLVSYTLRGKNVVRIAGKTSKPPTLAQLINRQKMAVTNAFLKPIIPFINLGFLFAIEGTAKHQHNEALSYNRLHALQGEYPNIEMDYSKALVSKGSLQSAINPAVSLLANGVEFTWEVAQDMEWGIKNDRTMLLAYFPEQQQAIYIFSGAQRKEGRDFLELPANLLDQPMHTYISFMADDKTSVSDSMWRSI